MERRPPFPQEARGEAQPAGGIVQVAELAHTCRSDHRPASARQVLVHRGKPGHRYNDHRRVLNGIVWVLRTGALWRDLPKRYGPWQSCYDRFVRWRRSGLWDRLLQSLQGEADQAGVWVWEVGFVDRSTVRAHQHAAGAPHQRAKAEEKRGSCWLLTRRSGRAAAA